MKYIILVLFSVFIAACSNKSIYDALQYNHELDCKKSTTSIRTFEYEECVAPHKDSYEEYTRKRTDSSQYTP